MHWKSKLRNQAFHGSSQTQINIRKMHNEFSTGKSETPMNERLYQLQFAVENK